MNWSNNWSSPPPFPPRLEPLPQKMKYEWKEQWNSGHMFHEYYINNELMAWIVPRPKYCDRGRFSMDTNLPDIDAADSFPRYYMDLERAKRETEEFVRWRLECIKARKRDGYERAS